MHLAFLRSDWSLAMPAPTGMTSLFDDSRARPKPCGESAATSCVVRIGAQIFLGVSGIKARNEVGHLDRGHGCVGTLVSRLQPGAIQCLLN